MSTDERAPVALDVFDGPAYSREIWSRATGLDSTVALGNSRAEHAAGEIARLAASVPSGRRIGSKEDLRRLCGVSVGTLNEAIKLAQTRGVITSRPGPGGGLFASDPSPLSRMNGWFREAGYDDSSFSEAVRIRDAIAPLLVEGVLRQMSADDDAALSAHLDEVHRTCEAREVAEFVWACWELHAYTARIGEGALLDSLYLSIMDVGTTFVQVKLEKTPPDEVDLAPLAQVMEDLVDALRRRDADAAVDALVRTVPTVILRAPG